MNDIRHVGIVVSDLERALWFYRDLLGLTVVRQMDEGGVYIDKLLGLKNTQVTTVKLSAGGGPTLVELLAFKSHHVENPSVRDVFVPGPTHVAFTVQDLEVLYQRLLDAGVNFKAPPQISPDRRVSVTYCQDPDGTYIELVQVLTGQ